MKVVRQPLVIELYFITVFKKLKVKYKFTQTKLGLRVWEYPIHYILITGTTIVYNKC